MMPSTLPRKGNRILSIDALRGFAMMLVILQHSYLSADMKTIPPFLDMLLWGVTYLAAVAFVSISGMMYSYFLFSSVDRGVVYRRYAARALFLILAAHPAINLLSYPFRAVGHGGVPDFHTFLLSLLLDFPITDTIGVCILVAPVFIVCLGSLIRAATIAAMLVSTVLIRALVIPPEAQLMVLKEAIFGGLGLPRYFWFPLIPWLAIFLSGSFVGQALAQVRQGTVKTSALIPKLNKAALALAFTGLFLTACYKVLRVAFGEVWSPSIFLAIYPGQTTSLLPGYLAVLLWVFSILLHRIDVSGCYDRFVWLLSISGRTSLFTYVVQFAVVESAPALLGLKGSLSLAGFLALFAIGQSIMWFLSHAYGRLRGWFQHNDYAEFVKMVKAACAAA